MATGARVAPGNQPACKQTGKTNLFKTQPPNAQAPPPATLYTPILTWKKKHSSHSNNPRKAELDI